MFPSRSIPFFFLSLVASFFNLIVLTTGLLTRILSVGYGYDPTQTNIVWCKSRVFSVQSSILVSLACVCLASVDRLCVSSRNVEWCNQSKLRSTQLAILIAIIVIIGFEVPNPIFYNLIAKTVNGTTSTSCSITSPGLVLYGSYFLRPFLFGIFPTAILIIMGTLTYRNISSIAAAQVRGSMQRRLTSMLLLQSIATVISIAPYASAYAYQTITSMMVKTAYQTAQETLAFDIVNLNLYINSASHFCIFVFCSTSCRRDFLRLVLFRRLPRFMENRIAPAALVA